MGVLLKVTTPRWIRGTLPRLQTLFHQKKNSEGLFPILNPRHHELAQKMVPSEQAQQQALSQSNSVSNKRAAIFVPLVFHDNKASIIFTKRSKHMKNHTSEISFPGGHQEEGESMVETALRETVEEIGGDWSAVVILGECTSIPSIRGTSVTAIIGILPEPVVQMDAFFTTNEMEVEEVFGLSIEELLRVETSRLLGRISAPAPVYPTKYGEIWGLTAIVLKPILHQLLKPIFVDGMVSENEHSSDTTSASKQL